MTKELPPLKSVFNSVRGTVKGLLVEAFGNPLEVQRRSMSQNGLLPLEVRNKLRYSETGNISRREILSLLANGWYDQCIYLLAKILHNDPDQQKFFLFELSSLCKDAEISDASLKKFLADFLETIPPDSSVQAGKLAQVDRTGRLNWNEAFEKKALKYEIDCKFPFLVAYASLGGLRYFIESAARTRRQFGVLIPDWIKIAEEPNCGYLFDFRSNVPQICLLPKTFIRPVRPIIFDETRNTGNVFKQMSAFWVSNGSVSLPETDCIVRTGHKKF